MVSSTSIRQSIRLITTVGTVSMQFVLIKPNTTLIHHEHLRSSFTPKIRLLIARVSTYMSTLNRQFVLRVSVSPTRIFIVCLPVDSGRNSCAASSIRRNGREWLVFFAWLLVKEISTPSCIKMPSRSLQKIRARCRLVCLFNAIMTYAKSHCRSVSGF